MQEEYIKDEQRNLKKEYLHAQEEVKRIQSVPLVIGQFLEAVDQNTGIVGSTTGSNYYVRILSTIDRELLKPSASVALHKHSNALVDVLPPEADSSISMLGADEKPDVSYSDIGRFTPLTRSSGAKTKTNTKTYTRTLSKDIVSDYSSRWYGHAEAGDERSSGAPSISL